jgi:hypothetical protein
VDGVGEVAVTGQPAGDEQLAFAGASGHRGLAGIALQRVRCLELFGMVADLTGDPGRETVTQARKAEVDLAAQQRRAPVTFGLGWQDAAAASGCAQQQLTHAPLPGSTLGADEQQLRDRELDGVDLGLGKCRAGGEVLAAQRLLDTVGEPVGVAAVGAAAKATGSWREVAASAVAVGQRCSIRRKVGAPMSGPAIWTAAGKTASRSARSRFSRRRSSWQARSSSRPNKRSSAASSPWGISGRSGWKRSSIHPSDWIRSSRR